MAEETGTLEPEDAQWCVLTASSKNWIALIHWGEAIMEQEVEIMVKPALQPVGVWDPQAAFDY